MSGDQLIKADIDTLESIVQAAFNAANQDEKQSIAPRFEELDRLRALLLTNETVAAASQLASKIDALQNQIDSLLSVSLLDDFLKIKRKVKPGADVTPLAGGGEPGGSPQQEPALPNDAQPKPTTGMPDGFDGPHIVVSDSDLDALARVAQSEVAVFGNFGEEQLRGGAAAVVDTIFNRVAHPKGEFPGTIQEVIDKPKQFSAINPLGSWTKLPAAKPSFFRIVQDHVKARAAGAPSRISGATHFLNPGSASVDAMEDWGNHLVANTIAWYGQWGGTFIHHHGFAPGYLPPPPHAIEYKGAISYFDGKGLPLATPVVAVEPTPASTVTEANLLPESWKPRVAMDRVIVHWTAGTYTASGIDKSRYHILIEHDGNTVRGKFSIADNVSNLVSNPTFTYAAHTRGANTKSIGVSVCCMNEAKESPFNAGQFPMTEIQWWQMVRIVAELCRTYDIPVTPTTVLGHGEVQKNLGRPQDNKWDPMVLPWNPGLSMAQVGDLFRAEVSKLV